MTIAEVIQLRNQGRTQDAYDAARQLYAVDKGQQASTVMFWSATDMLELQLAANRSDDARKILLAMQRLLSTATDTDGQMRQALQRCEAAVAHHVNAVEMASQGYSHLDIGKWGEEVAADFLREKGFVLIDRNWRSVHRDIDIIAYDDDTLVFVEVKTRSTADFGSPLTAIDQRKRWNLNRSINHYLRLHNIMSPFRLDIVSVVGVPGGAPPVIEHIADVDMMQTAQRPTRSHRRRT